MRLEQSFTAYEKKLLFVPNSENDLVTDVVSNDFFALERNILVPATGKHISAFHESEGKRWLQSLLQSDGFLTYQQVRNGDKTIRHGTVRGVILTESLNKGSLNPNSSIREPDFVVVLEDHKQLKVGGYEIKSAASSLDTEAAEQISHANTEKLIKETPLLDRKIQELTNGQSIDVVEGIILLPNSLKNNAFLASLEPFENYKNQVEFPADTIYPYSLHRLQSGGAYQRWTPGRSVRFFPSRGYVSRDFPAIAQTAYTVGIDRDLLDDPFYFSKKIHIDDRMAAKTNLPSGSEVTTAIPYTGWEVMQIATSAALELQKRELDLDLTYSEFISQFEDLSLFSFMQVLNYELSRGKKAGSNGNGRKNGTVYQNGNDDKFVPFTVAVQLGAA